jgi:primosomal protein N'
MPGINAGPAPGLTLARHPHRRATIIMTLAPSDPSAPPAPAAAPAPLVVRVALEAPLRRLFDYLAAGPVIPAPGCRVRVSFGRQQAVGLVLEHAAASGIPTAKLKPLGEVLDEQPVLDPCVLALVRWAADYYHHPIGEALAAALPRWTRAGARRSGHWSHGGGQRPASVSPNAREAAAGCRKPDSNRTPRRPPPSPPLRRRSGATVPSCCRA